METMDASEDSAVSIAQESATIRDIPKLAYVPIALCLVLVGWLYMPTFTWWWGEWWKKESYYSHGVLIPPIAVFLLWLKTSYLKETPIRPYALGYLVVVLALAGAVVATLASARTMVGMTLPLLLGGMVLVLFGRAMARQSGFSIAYLYFMCVLPSFLLTVLSFRIQMLSTMGGTMLLRLLGFDAYREGAMITLPNAEVLVGAPCSGFRFLISLFAFSILLAHLLEGSLWRRLSLVVVTLPLSLLVNSIRITFIAIVGEFMGTDAMVKFHDHYAGPIEMALGFAMFLFFAWLIGCRSFNPAVIPPPNTENADPDASHSSPARRTKRVSGVQLHAYVLVVLLALVTSTTMFSKPLRVEGRSETDFSKMPMELGEWVGRAGRFDEKTYEQLPSCSLLLRFYEHEIHPNIELAIVYGTDLGDFHQPEICLEGQGLRSVGKDRVQIREGGGTSFEAVELITESDYGRRMFLFWFYSEGVSSTSLGTYKVRVFSERLRTRRVQPSALIRLSTEVLGSDEEAIDRLVRFAEEVVPYIRSEFGTGQQEDAHIGHPDSGGNAAHQDGRVVSLRARG